MVISTGANMRHRERKWKKHFFFSFFSFFLFLEKLIKICRVRQGINRVGRVTPIKDFFLGLSVPFLSLWF